MGKGLNPADQERKLQKKKDIQKHKKREKETSEVRNLLSDPDKIEDELQKLRKESDSNKLDLNIKNKIKEMQKMKDIAVKKLVNQKMLDQLRANSLKGIQEAERQDKNLKTSNTFAPRPLKPVPRPGAPPQQVSRPLLVGGLHGVPLPPPPMLGAPRPPMQMPMQGMMMPMQGMMMPMQGMMMPMQGMMMPMQGMMMPMQGMMMPPMPNQYNQMQQNPRGQKRPIRQTANVDPMDPKGEHYVEKFIGYDRLQKQQQQTQKQQHEQLQRERLQEEQIQEVQRIEDDNKWSQLETDVEKVEDENGNENDGKWSQFETETVEQDIENEHDYEIENESKQDGKWSKWDVNSSPSFDFPTVNPEDIMKRRFATNDSSSLADVTIPDISINVEELMRRRNMIPVDDTYDVGPSLGPTIPSEPYEMYQTLPTVDDLLQNSTTYDDDTLISKSNQSVGGGLLGLCQYDSEGDDEDGVDNNQTEDGISDNISTLHHNAVEYALNIPIQAVTEIEPKKALIKVKADSALTSFVPTSLKMKRPNPNLSSSSNPTKVMKMAPTEVNAVNAPALSNESKDDAYSKFLAEISGL